MPCTSPAGRVVVVDRDRVVRREGHDRLVIGQQGADHESAMSWADRGTSRDRISTIPTSWRALLQRVAPLSKPPSWIVGRLDRQVRSQAVVHLLEIGRQVLGTNDPHHGYPQHAVTSAHPGCGDQTPAVPMAIVSSSQHDNQTADRHRDRQRLSFGRAVDRDGGLITG